jgi:hypothetical protein
MTETTEATNSEGLAKAIYDALESNDPEAYLGPFVANQPITIDGKFDLISVARAVAASFRASDRKPT